MVWNVPELVGGVVVITVGVVVCWVDELQPKVTVKESKTSTEATTLAISFFLLPNFISM